MKIYLDSNFCCHLTDDGTMRQVDTDLFDGKCAAYIEGYRYIPIGESWTDPNGIIFTGQVMAPVENYLILAKIQAQYEADIAQMADMQIALNILGVSE